MVERRAVGDFPEMKFNKDYPANVLLAGRLFDICSPFGIHFLKLFECVFSLCCCSVNTLRRFLSYPM